MQLSGEAERCSPNFVCAGVGGSSIVTVTTDPQVTNRSIDPSVLTESMTLNAVVKSVEEKGVILKALIVEN